MNTIFSTAALIGIDVVDLNEVSLGTIEDFIVNIQSERVDFVVISSGGYLGIDDRLYAIHTSFFELNGDDETLIFNPRKGAKGRQIIDLPDHYEEMEVFGVDQFIQMVTKTIEEPGHRTDISEY